MVETLPSFGKGFASLSSASRDHWGAFDTPDPGIRASTAVSKVSTTDRFPLLPLHSGADRAN